MHVAPAPEFRLFPENIAALIPRPVLGTPENAAWMGISRLDVIEDETVVTSQRGAVVIPVHRHRKRVANEHAPQSAAGAIAIGRC